MIKKVLLTAGLLFVFILMLSLLSYPQDNSTLNGYTCPVNASMLYFFQEGCSACAKMEPLINELPSKGCSVTKLDVRLNSSEAVKWNVLYTPTYVVCGERHVGAVSAQELKLIINNDCS